MADKKFKFDYKKYDTGISKQLLKNVLNELWTSGTSTLKMIFLALKILVTFAIFWMIHKQTDIELEADKQKYISEIEDGSQGNVDV